MSLTSRFSPDCKVEHVSDALKRDGYAVIEHLLDSASLQRLRSELDPWIDNTDFGDEDFWGQHTKRFGALVAKSKIAQEMLIHPMILGVADRVLLEWCASYWVNYTGVMYLTPGETAQRLHRDTNI